MCNNWVHHNNCVHNNNCVHKYYVHNCYHVLNYHYVLNFYYVHNFYDVLNYYYVHNYDYVHTMSAMCIYTYTYYVHNHVYHVQNHYYVLCTLLCTQYERDKLHNICKLQIIFHKRATKYRSLLQKRTYKDKGSYESSPPCT